MSIILKFVQKTAEAGILPNLLFKVSITFIPKTEKNTIRKENTKPLSLLNIDTKVLKKILIK
jgi:hypothetical protein